ncbi:MAG TPA: DNA gyrase inhibitor YacG [Blastocatellia bacterium]|nr:DNA gyrase inhibitor YacG [Blastocatellia bacterium]
MKCPICGRPTQWNDNAYRPFCGERCRTLDLGKWASEEYHVPVAVADLDEESADLLLRDVSRKRLD